MRPESQGRAGAGGRRATAPEEVVWEALCQISVQFNSCILSSEKDQVPFKRNSRHKRVRTLVKPHVAERKPGRKTPHGFSLVLGEKKFRNIMEISNWPQFPRQRNRSLAHAFTQQITLLSASHDKAFSRPVSRSCSCSQYLLALWVRQSLPSTRSLSAKLAK